jgi:hypothetical protein
MGNAILFQEVQGAKSSTYRFFRIVGFLFAIALVFNLIKQQGSITNATQLLFIGALICAVIVLMGNIRMITQIKEDGIYVNFAPFQPRFVKYEWTNIQTIYIRKYNALVEYRGWGIKTGVMGKGYIISGDTGLQIILKDGTQVLIGTHRPEEMEAVLQEFIKND